MKRLQSIKFFVLTFIILVSISSCTKEDLYRDGEFAGITVSLKSSASEFNKVFIDIEDVQIKIKDDGNAPNAWLSLNAINLGSHNVSNLKNNSELLLVDHFEIKPTYIHEIRLVLGDNNFIDLNQTLFSLDVTERGNSMPSNLVKTELSPGHFYDVVINIDIDESISFNENMMVLNPKLYTEIRKF